MTTFRGADRREYERWRKMCGEIASATGGGVAPETDAQRRDRVRKLLDDPRAFQEYYFPQLEKTPEYLVQAARRVLDQPRFFGWWMMFRGARKTTWAAVILPLMLKARGELSFMLLVGPNEKFSKRILGNLQAQLEFNARFVADFGEQMRHGDWAEGEFSTRDGAAFVGLGMGQPVRGLNVNFKRPDYLLASDLDGKELSKNPARCREMYRWLMEDVMGTFETGAARQRFLFDNNLFSKTSLGWFLKESNPAVEIVRVDMLDENGRPAADFITPEYVESLRGRIGFRAFQREYMNDPVEEGAIFKAEWIVWAEALPWREYDEIVAYCDPSFKNKTTSDYKAVAVVGRKGTRICVLKAFCRQCTVAELVNWLYDFDENAPENCAVKYFVEAGFLQDLILDEFYREGEKRGRQLPVRPDKRQKPDKFQRVEAMSPLWERGLATFSQTERADRDMLAALDQTLAFEKGSSKHDDFPDALEGAVYILQRSGRAAAAPPVVGLRKSTVKW